MNYKGDSINKIRMRKSDYTILVADDDPDYLFQTISSLEKAGYKTVAVESQSEAEAVISKLKPNLAIFDLMMEIRPDDGE